MVKKRPGQTGPFLFDPVQDFTITFLAVGTRDGDILIQGIIPNPGG